VTPDGAGLSDGKDECTPAIRNRVAAATQSECACRQSSSNWQKRWGHGEAGMESEEGMAATPRNSAQTLQTNSSRRYDFGLSCGSETNAKILSIQIASRATKRQRKVRAISGVAKTQILFPSPN
jgi:hypothetical protein